MTTQPTIEELTSVYAALDARKMNALFDGDDDTFSKLDSECRTVARDIERLKLNPRAVLVGKYFSQE